MPADQQIKKINEDLEGIVAGVRQYVDKPGISIILRFKDCNENTIVEKNIISNNKKMYITADAYYMFFLSVGSIRRHVRKYRNHTKVRSPSRRTAFVSEQSIELFFVVGFWEALLMIGDFAVCESPVAASQPTLSFYDTFHCFDRKQCYIKACSVDIQSGEMS